MGFYGSNIGWELIPYYASLMLPLQVYYAVIIIVNVIIIMLSL